MKLESLKNGKFETLSNNAMKFINGGVTVGGAYELETQTRTVTNSDGSTSTQTRSYRHSFSSDSYRPDGGIDFHGSNYYWTDWA